MKLQVLLFAGARQAAGQECVDVELASGATVAQLRDQLVERFPELLPWRQQLLIAVNHQFAADEVVLPDGSEVACFPPVSGG